MKNFCRRVQNESTEDFNSLPYICTLSSAAQWTYYGLIKPEGLLISTVYGSGTVLEAVYVIMFIIYAPGPAASKVCIYIFSLLREESHFRVEYYEMVNSSIDRVFNEMVNVFA